MADRDHERGTAGESAAASGGAHGDAAPRRDRVRDPVCGMMITPSDATLRSDHEDVRYYFCSTGCKARFDAAPESYRAAAGIEGDDAGFAKPHGDPVHPGEASRPMGGMAVFRAGLGLAGEPQPEHVHADRHGRRRAWTYSVVATLAPRIFPPAFQTTDGMIAVYYEAAAVIVVLALLGQVLEMRAREQTSGAIRALVDLAPKTARRIAEDGSEDDIDTKFTGLKGSASAGVTS